MYLCFIVPKGGMRIFHQPHNSNNSYLFFRTLLLGNTAECRYNAVQYSKIMHRNCRSWGRISIHWWTRETFPHLALAGELWGVFGEYLWENLPRYNGTALISQTTHVTEVETTALCRLRKLVRWQHIYIFGFWMKPWVAIIISQKSHALQATYIKGMCVSHSLDTS